MIYLDVIREENFLKLFIKESGDTISLYKEMLIEMDKIEKLCTQMTDLINFRNRNGIKGSDLLEKLRESGNLICDEILHPDIKIQLLNSDSRDLIMETDDHMVHIPWELLCIDDNFLCQQFNMGRNVKTRQNIIKTQGKNLSRPLKMWILANPEGDLFNAGSEGILLCEEMDAVNQDETILEADYDCKISPEQIRGKIRHYDFVHFAGHGVYDSQHPGQSGWRLTDGKVFQAGDVKKMAGSPMPSLVFSNACQSAQTNEWEFSEDKRDNSFGLANAFMLAGVKHYIGSSWEIKDKSGKRFARAFYRFLISGHTIGEAVRMARAEQSQDDNSYCWAGYVLYGDPAFRYFKRNRKIEVSKKPPLSNDGIQPDSYSLRNIIKNDIPTLKNVRKSIFLSFPKQWIIISMVLILAILLSFTGWKYTNDTWTSKPLRMAVVFDPDSFNADTENIISLAIEYRILSYPRIQLIDRRELKTILDELKLNVSEWVRDSRRLDPDLLPVSLFLSVRFDQSESLTRVLMRLKETETGRLINVYHESLAEGSIISQKDRLAQAVLQTLKERYPLRGRVNNTNGNNIMLNIGDSHGVQLGQKFKLIDSNIVLKVVSVEAKCCTTVIEKGKRKIGKNLKAEAL